MRVLLTAPDVDYELLLDKLLLTGVDFDSVDMDRRMYVPQIMVSSGW